MLSADVVFAPNYASKGLLADLTSRVNALKFKDALAPGHIKASTYQGKIYAVPHDIDLSAMFYNKVLFKKAGLDPEKPPTTVKEMVDARARSTRSAAASTASTSAATAAAACSSRRGR